MTDMVEHPAFVDALLDAICDWNLAVVRRALATLDVVYPIRTAAAERTRWNRLIAERHYLRSNRMVGEQLRHVVANGAGEWLARLLAHEIVPGARAVLRGLTTPWDRAERVTTPRVDLLSLPAAFAPERGLVAHRLAPVPDPRQRRQYSYSSILAGETTVKGIAA